MNALYVVNLKEEEISIQKHTYLAGFGKGSYKRFGAEDTLPDKCIVFVLKDQDTLVVYNNAVVKLADVLLPERKKKPAASPCYHVVKVEPTDPNRFTLEVQLRVAFVPAEEGNAGQPTTNNCAARVLALYVIM